MTCMTLLELERFIVIATNLTFTLKYNVLLFLHGTAADTLFVWDGVMFCTDIGILS